MVRVYPSKSCGPDYWGLSQCCDPPWGTWTTQQTCTPHALGSSHPRACQDVRDPMKRMTCPWHNYNSDCPSCPQPSSDTPQEENIKFPQGCDSTDLSSESFSCLSHAPSASTFTSDSQDESASSSGSSSGSVSFGSVFDANDYEESYFSSSHSSLSDSRVVNSDPGIANIYRLIQEQLASRRLTNKKNDYPASYPSPSSSSESEDCLLDTQTQDSPFAPSSPSLSSVSGGCLIEIHNRAHLFAPSPPTSFSSPSSSSSTLPSPSGCPLLPDFQDVEPRHH